MRFLLIIVIIICSSCNNTIEVEEETYLIKNKHKIHVKSTGKGEPILFIHGGYLDLEMWDSQVTKFKTTNKIIRYSDLGHGKTERGENSIMGYELINDITNRYSDDKYVLVGLSWGAMLSVDFALNYPSKVKKLVLVSPGLNGWDYFKDSLALKNYNLRQIAIEDLDTLKSAELFHKNWVIGPRRTKNQINACFHKESQEIIARNMREHWGEDWSNLDTIIARNRLENITVPTYIIVGKQDAEDIIMIADEYNNRIVKSKKIEVDSVAHLLNMENPTKFNRILEKILKE